MAKTLVSLIIKLLLLISIGGGLHGFASRHYDDPLKSFTAPRTPEIKISRALLAAIKKGDFVHPTFAPDGNILAYSNVLVQRDFEYTEVFLYNLVDQKRSVLLDSNRAKSYGTYKAYVSEMDWKTPKRLEVEISDGDVDSTRLIINPSTRRLIGKTSESFDGSTSFPMSSLNQKSYLQAKAIFPSFPPEVLESALRQNAFAIPDKGIVLQKTIGDDILFLDFKTSRIRSLLKLSPDTLARFLGGFTFNSSIVFMLSYQDMAYLFVHREGTTKGLGLLTAPSHSWIDVKHISDSRVIFLIKAHSPSERGDNPLFVFDGKHLARVKEYSQLYDADVDARGKRIAFCYWEGDKRHLEVKQLDSPRSLEK